MRVNEALLPCIGLFFFAFAEACDPLDGLKCNKLLSALFKKPLKEKILEKKCDKLEPPAGSTIVLMPAEAPVHPPVLPHHHHHHHPVPCRVPQPQPICHHHPVHPKPTPCHHRPQPVIIAPHSHPHPPIPVPFHPPTPLAFPVHPLPPVAVPCPPHFIPAPVPLPCPPQHSPLVISIVNPDSLPHHHSSHCDKFHHHHHLPSPHLPCPLPPAVPMIAYALPPPVPCTLEPKKIHEKVDKWHKFDKFSNCECDCDD